jgi:hypothetical protein
MYCTVAVTWTEQMSSDSFDFESSPSDDVEGPQLTLSMTCSFPLISLLYVIIFSTGAWRRGVCDKERNVCSLAFRG